MASSCSTNRCATYDQACMEARKWIEEATELRFPSEDFRGSLRNGVLLCKLAEKLSGINAGELNPIPRSLAWMDNLTTFLNICRFIGLKKSQLFRVDDLAAVRNQDLPLKTKHKEESRKVRNVLITIFWLGRLAYSLGTYQGPLPDLDAFENLINKQRPPEMIDEYRQKFELGSLSASSGSGAGTWPRIQRSSGRSRSLRVEEGSLEHFERMRQELIPHLNAKVREKADMYDRIQRVSNEEEAYLNKKFQRPRSSTTPLPDSSLPGKTGIGKNTRRARSLGVLEVVNDDKPSNAEMLNGRSFESITRRTPVKVAISHEQKTMEKRHMKPSVTDGHTMSSVKHPKHQSFRYDNNPVLRDLRRTEHSGVSNHGKHRSSRKNEYVSVTELIQQWSNVEGEGNKPVRPIDNDKTNRRSLPANFPVNCISSKHEEPQLRRAKSISADMYSQAVDNYPKKTFTKTFSSEPAEPKRNPPRNISQHGGDARRYSESVKHYTSGCGKVMGEWEGSSTAQQKSRSETTRCDEENKTQLPIGLYSEKRGKTKDVQDNLRDCKGSVVHGRESVLVNVDSSNQTQSPYPGICRENDIYYDRRKSEPNKKYATMPTRLRSNHEKDAIRAHGTKKTEFGVGKDAPTIQSEQKYENDPIKGTYMKKPLSQRRLPTYEEAIEPLQEVHVSHRPVRRNSNQTEFGKEQIWGTAKGTASRDLSAEKNSVRETPKGKQLIEESVSKEHYLPVATSVELHSLFQTDDSVGRATREILDKNVDYDQPMRDSTNRRIHMTNKRTATAEYSVRPPNEFISNKLTSPKLELEISQPKQLNYSKQRSEANQDVFLANDVNNNRFEYDEQTLKSSFMSKKPSGESSARSAQDMTKNGTDRQNKFTTDFPRSLHGKENEVKYTCMNEQQRLREQQKIVLDEDFKQRGTPRMAPGMVKEFTKQGGATLSSVVNDDELLELVAAEEKYWKAKVESKDRGLEAKVNRKSGVVYEKQKRVDEMLREYKRQDHGAPKYVDYSEMTDTLRAEEEFFAQEAEKLLKERFQKNSVKEGVVSTKVSKVDMMKGGKIDPWGEMKLRDENHYNIAEQPRLRGPDDSNTVNMQRVPPRSPQSTRQVKPPSVTGSDDLSLKPEADQAYHNMQPRKVSRSKSLVYMCSGCRLPVERDICLYVSELQSYWHEKCFRCSVCHTNLIRGRSTPKIRVMFARIHCENCLSSRRTGGQSTMV